mmetsp:Transcript_17102/g.15067  ORF Transcript_17102/g.15067 Transcript_17102/m.15067 type:complete len:81 (+) Transcript_17102:553-795(+)
MMQVNNEYFYEDLTQENTKLLLDKMKEGEGFEAGPQTHRTNSEGPEGRTTLSDIKPVIHKRDFKKAKEDWEAAKAEGAKK